MIGVIFVSFLYSQVDSLIDTSRVDTTTYAPYKLTDFMIPESGAMSFLVDLSYWMHGDIYSRQETSYEDTLVSRSVYQQKTGSLEGNFLISGEKRRLNWSFETELSLSGWSYDHAHHRYQDGELLPDGFRDRDNFFSIHLNPSGGIEYYPFSDIFYVGFYSTTGTSAASGSGVDTSLYESRKTKGSGYSEFFLFYPKIGLGRIVPLYYPSNALEIAKVLSKNGISQNPGLVKEVAGLLARRWEYPLKYRHADWEFFEDLEEVFEKHNITRADMSVKTWMQIIDASNTWKSRSYGIKVFLKPKFYQLNEVASTWSLLSDQPEYTLSNYYERSILSTSLQSIYLDFGYPLSNNSHLEGSFSFSALPGLLYDFQHYIEMKLPYTAIDTIIMQKEAEITGFGFSYELSNTTIVWNFFDISPSLYGDYEQKLYYSGNESIVSQVWHNELYLKGECFFSDKFSFSVWSGLSAVLNKTRESQGSFNIYPHLSIGLNYRIF